MALKERENWENGVLAGMDKFETVSSFINTVGDACE